MSLEPTLLADLNPLPSTEPLPLAGNLVSTGGSAYFFTTEVGGERLWRIRSTGDAIEAVADVRSSSLLSPALTATVMSDSVYFIASGAAVGDYDLWRANDNSDAATLVTTFSINGRVAAMTVWNDRLYWIVDLALRPELWTSDGTAEGTALVSAFTSSSPSYLNVAMRATSGQLFFSIQHPSNGIQLWKSDGTSAGTTVVKQLPSGGAITYLTELNGQLYFVGDSKRNLWRSDGTAAGTVAVTNSSSSFAPQSLTPLGGKLYFTANDALGRELWVSDGTTDGTMQVVDIQSGSGSGLSHSSPLVAHEGALYFSANDGVHGSEVWRSDGTTAGTSMLREFVPGPDTSRPRGLISANNGFYFIATDPAQGEVLWRTDGTADGTQLLGGPGQVAASPKGARLGDGVAFALQPYYETRVRLWISDGTVESTKALSTETTGDSVHPENGFARIGSATLYAGADGIHGVELWTTDGTLAGTLMLADLLPGAADSDPSGFIEFANTVYFTAWDGAARRLWRTDGTVQGTVAIDELGAPASYSITSTPVMFNGKLVFAASTEISGRDLWTSDGTAAGTERLIDLAPEALPNSLKVEGGTLFFKAFANQLWMTDGTSAGTRRMDGELQYQDLGDFARDGDITYFVLKTAQFGEEIWRTDGTPGGTQLLTDLRPGKEGSAPRELTIVGDRLYFTADDGTNGRELWAVRLTGEQLQRLTSVYPYFPDVEPMDLISFAGRVVFRLERCVWRSDGTPEGTTKVHNSWVYTNSFHRLGDRLYFHGPGLQSENRERFWSVGPDLDDVEEVTSVPVLSDFLASSSFRATDGLWYGSLPSHPLGVEPWVSDGTEVGTRMLRDIAPGPTSLYSVRFFELNGQVYFQASGEEVGRVLYRTDGTPEGTEFVGSIDVEVAVGAELAGVLYFVASDDEHGTELWRFDGTVAGTYPLKDIWPGPNSGAPRDLVVHINLLYFTATDDIAGRELWRSDGTAEGTYRVVDLRPGIANAFSSTLGWLESSDDWLYFTADNNRQRGLFRTDGTPDGTVLLKETPYFFGDFSWLTDVGGTLFAMATDTKFGMQLAQLWKSDGTVNGTELVTDFGNGNLIGTVRSLGGTLLWHHWTETFGDSIWRSDGTAATTKMVRALRPGATRSGFRSEAVAGDFWYFRATDDEHGSELWRTDGTWIGTFPLDIMPGVSPSDLRSIYSFGDRLVFSAQKAEGLWEPWTSDGTVAGTHRTTELSLIDPRLAAFRQAKPARTSGYDFALLPDGKLWRSDGTEAGTSPVSDQVFFLDPGTGPLLAPLGRSVLFAAHTGDGDTELWTSDGTLAGTRRVTDIQPGEVGSLPSAFVSHADAVYFVADDGAFGRELWRSDGSAAGTWRISDINPGIGDSAIASLVSDDGRLSFQATDATGYRGIWQYHAPSAQLSSVVSYEPTNFHSRLLYGAHVDLNGVSYGVLDDGVHGQELWRTDGTLAGTWMVRDLRSGDRDSRIRGLTVWNGTLYFSADDGLLGRELWHSDGTAAGTQVVRDIAPGPSSSGVDQVLASERGLFFKANDEFYRNELWFSDGTADGTRLVKDIAPIQLSSSPGNFVELQGMVFFLATTPETGYEVWRTDGTADGTTMVADFRSGVVGSAATPWQVGRDGRLLFLADDGVHGLEPWVLETIPGDTDYNGVVDIADLNRVRNNFGRTGAHAPGDANGDGEVNIADLNAVRNNFGQAASAPTPPPASTLVRDRAIRPAVPLNFIVGAHDAVFGEYVNAALMSETQLRRPLRLRGRL